MADRESLGASLLKGARPSASFRHARPCAGHPRLKRRRKPKMWMAGTIPAMTASSSSLPDLIRQSMGPHRCMDRRVKPGGDEGRVSAPKAKSFRPFISDNPLAVCPRLRYMYDTPRPSVGRARAGRPGCGARAVPARGVATRSRAASGCSPDRHYDRSARSIAALWLAGSRVTPA